MSKRPREHRYRRRTPLRLRDLLRLTSAAVVAVTAVGVLSVIAEGEQGFDLETVAASDGRGSAAAGTTSSTLGEDGEELPVAPSGDLGSDAMPGPAGGATSSSPTGPDPERAAATGEPGLPTAEADDDIDGAGGPSSALGTASVGVGVEGDAVTEPAQGHGEPADEPTSGESETGTPHPAEWISPPAAPEAEDSAPAASRTSASAEAENDAVTTSTPATTTPATTAASTTTRPPTDAAAATTTTTSPPRTTTTTTAPTTTTTTTAPPTTTTTTTAPAPTTTTAPTTSDATSEGTGSSGAGEIEDAPADAPTPAQWAALRACESDGDYTAVSGSGRYFGAYQFHQSTWDWLARISGRSEAVGQPPNEASPALQDALARLLWRRSGPGQWPVCGGVLTDGG